MSAADDIKSSCGDEVELEGGSVLSVPPTKTQIIYIFVTDYNEDDKKVTILRTYKIEKRIVFKSIVLRKTRPKINECCNNKPGPELATTIVAKEDKQEDECEVEKLKAGTSALDDSAKPTCSKYIPPSMREGAVKRFAQIKISNLSESTTRTDLEDLLRPFGPRKKLYLAKHKQTGYCKGFAFIHFLFYNDAVKAITHLDGYSYNHLNLIVDWSKPPGHSNQSFLC